MRTAPLFAALAVLLTPELAEACSVCFSGQDQSRTAFIATTAFLSILPLVLIGSMVFWIRSRARALETRGEDAEHGLLASEPWKRAP